MRPRLAAPAPSKRPKRRWGAVAVLVVVVAAGAFVVTKFLGSALDYYCNVDELNVKPACSGNKNLRIQGTVEKGSIVQSSLNTRFVMAFNGKSVPVVYDGDPAGKFQECIPVVVRGRLSNGTFLGNEVEVKHSNTYAAKNPDRLKAANSAPCPQAT